MTDEYYRGSFFVYLYYRMVLRDFKNIQCSSSANCTNKFIQWGKTCGYLFSEQNPNNRFPARKFEKPIPPKYSIIDFLIMMWLDCIHDFKKDVPEIKEWAGVNGGGLRAYIEYMGFALDKNKKNEGGVDLDTLIYKVINERKSKFFNTQPLLLLLLYSDLRPQWSYEIQHIIQLHVTRRLYI